MAVNVAQLSITLYPLLRGLCEQAMEEAWDGANEALNISGAFDVDDPFVQGVLGDLMKSIADDIAETTREEWRAVIARAEAEGWSIERREEEMIRLKEDVPRTRAELIAVTETARARSLGSRARYQAAGLTQWEWLTTADEMTCDICGPLNGRRVEMGKDFGGATEPPAHPRCRCTVVPVVG